MRNRAVTCSILQRRFGGFPPVLMRTVLRKAHPARLNQHRDIGFTSEYDEAKYSGIALKSISAALRFRLHGGFCTFDHASTVLAVFPSADTFLLDELSPADDK